MAEADHPKRQLLEALADGDTRTRDARANRIIWLSQFERQRGTIVGELESSSLLEEARVCYINAHYIATVLAATAFVEHTLDRELEERQIAGPRFTLQQATISARKAALFPAELLDRTDELRAIRNALAHRKPGHADSLSERFRDEKMHPDAVLERDAQLALEVMYEYFWLTLRKGDWPA